MRLFESTIPSCLVDRSKNKIYYSKPTIETLKMKRGRKPSTKNEVAADNSKPKKIKSTEDVKSGDSKDRIASLPLHGEYLPVKGYSAVPTLVSETRQSLVEVFQMVRNQKRLGDKVSFAIHLRTCVRYHVLRSLHRLT